MLGVGEGSPGGELVGACLPFILAIVFVTRQDEYLLLFYLCSSSLIFVKATEQVI